MRVLDEKVSIPEGMVRVMGAETEMGKFDDFYIDRYEVTNRQFKEFIDSDKFAYYGVSWGGWMGAYIPAVEGRLKASILLAGGFDLINPRPRPEVRKTNYVNRVKVPTLMINGRYDSFGKLEAAIKPMFDLLGTPDEHKELILYDTDHIPPKNDFIRDTLAWLDRYLGPVK